MADILKGQGAVEQAEADKLTATATAIGAGALSRTTLAAASEAIRAVQADLGRGVTSEIVADLRALRTNPALQAALAADLRVALASARLLIEDALWLGFRTAAISRSKLTETGRLKLTVDLTEADRAELRDYPILGHTPAEVAASLIDRLSFEVGGALALPLTGRIDPATIPAAIGGVSVAHGERLGAAVSEGYFAGIQAASKALGAALVGS